MDDKKKTRIMDAIQIINTLIWAALLLISSYVLKGTENREVIFLTLVMGSALQISLLGYISGKFFPRKKCIPGTTEILNRR